MSTRLSFSGLHLNPSWMEVKFVSFTDLRSPLKPERYDESSEFWKRMFIFHIISLLENYVYILQCTMQLTIMLLTAFKNWKIFSKAR